MPTYEYRCPRGHLFERFYPTINDRRRAKCPKCGKLAERLISGGAGLVFKGSGFYITDYKRAAEKGEGKKSSDSESQPTETGKGKKDSAGSDT
ncbi:MAG TPA: FmdB family zinc ribbon protein [Gemmatimonadales bacterium]|nr:FmdB family zinc ribbon protein [Gemmatimonadales bacterium]